MEIGELGGDGLADDDRAGGAQPGDNGGVVPGPASSGERRTEFGRIVRGVDDVLDRDRNAVQPTERVALHAALVERPRLRRFRPQPRSRSTSQAHRLPWLCSCPLARSTCGPAARKSCRAPPVRLQRRLAYLCAQGNARGLRGFRTRAGPARTDEGRNPCCTAAVFILRLVAAGAFLLERS